MTTTADVRVATLRELLDEARLLTAEASDPLLTTQERVEHGNAALRLLQSILDAGAGKTDTQTFEIRDERDRLIRTYTVPEPEPEPLGVHDFIDAGVAGVSECSVCNLPEPSRFHTAKAVTKHAVARAHRHLDSGHVREPFIPTDTQDTAADKVRVVKAGSRRAAVLEMVVNAGEWGITDAELFAALPHVPQNTVRPRRVELVEGGLIEDTRTERDDHMVWRVTDVGRQVWTDLHG